MLHELLVTLSGHPGDIFRPFPPAPLHPTTFAVIGCPFLDPAEKEGLDRLAQLGYHFRELNAFIRACQSSSSSISSQGSPYSKIYAGLYLKALAHGLDRKLDTYRQAIVESEAAILSGEDNLGGMVPLSTLSARFAPFKLVFPSIERLANEIREDASSTTPLYSGVKLLDLLQTHATSGIPIQKEWMSELFQGCCTVMIRQIISWVVYGQIQDPFGEFFIHSQNAQSSRGQFFDSSLVTSKTRTPTPTSRSNGRWQADYCLDESLIPSMIPSDLADAMLFIGKSITTSRQAKPKPIAIPPEMTRRHLSLMEPFISQNRETASCRLDMASFKEAIHQIRRDMANHLWVVVRVGDSVVRTLETFRRYFLLSDGEFGLKLIETIEGFRKDRLTRNGSFSVSIRDHDLYDMLTKASVGTPAQDDLALLSFELRLLKPSRPQLAHDTYPSDPRPAGIFDDQLLGIPVRLWYSLTWPLDFFLTTEDLGHYGDVFAFLIAVRKTQVKLQQTWVELRYMAQEATRRRKRSKSAGIGKGPSNEEDQQEADILKHASAIRSNMAFVADCLWTYLQMDVIGPTYNLLLKTILTSNQENSSHSSTTSTITDASTRCFDLIYTSHAEALYEIRRACLLTSESLSQSLKTVLLDCETFCGIILRRVTGRTGFQAGLGDRQDEIMWQDWTDITTVNQTFRQGTTQLFSALSAISQSGTLGDGPLLKRSTSGLGSSILGGAQKSMYVIRQLDQLLLRLEYSKDKWFSDEAIP